MGPAAFVDRKLTLLKFPQRAKTTSEMFIEAAEKGGAHSVVLIYQNGKGQYGYIANVGDPKAVNDFIDKARTGFKT